ncbi:MAG: GspE/PulE family protein [Candidatus Gracilibacteria bacterium]|nr:GspE/PulE family protein [Candidatus Gracilibacteria bacterium]
MTPSPTIQNTLAKITNAFHGMGKKNDILMQGVSPADISAPIQMKMGNVAMELDNIFSKALSLGASDIHIEPDEDTLLLRIRVDGRFMEYGRFPNSEKAPLIAKIKILSSLKIDEQRLPQDGKATYHDAASGKNVDLRVSIIPTIYGEKVVIRLLRKESELMDLRSIGVLPMNMVKIKKHLENQFGLVLIVGPTGSGKSTTLYSMLSRFDPEEKNISTLEDPVEYRIKGVNHTQINPQIGFNFADGLRSLLRQDPDVIMVGEIRDSETARLAVEASITGHLVFSTIHANSTVNTLQRLTNLGIDPLLITSSLRLIVSQRLARKLCPHCKVAYKPDESIKKKVLSRIGKYVSDPDELMFYHALEGGCEKCGHKGHKGRTGFFEILEMTEGIEKLVLSHASKTQLEIQAVGDGMITIKDDALIKVVLGEVSLEEVLQVLGG